MLYHKEKRKILVLSLSAVAVSVIFNWIFIGLYAALGAAIATLVSYTVILLMVMLFVKPMLAAVLQKNTL